MTGGQTAVARATAAVFVDGQRTGLAVLVAPRHLVTAAHVLRRQDPDTLAMVTVEQVELEFPDQEPGGQLGRMTAVRVDLGPAGAGVDVAVLDLGEDRPGSLPALVPVWPTARPPTKVQVFGYPLAEGPLNGVWRQFMVAGPATAGTVQLDWISDAGTFPGHSGGPVIDADGHALAGILVAGAERGRFDRFVPVTLIARVWPRLPRPWLMAGAEPGEARGHFTRRARGQPSVSRGGDLFRGRQAVLRLIRSWLTADELPGEPLVIIGQPGAGKSAVLARTALGLEAEHGGPGLAFHAKGATSSDFLTALADLIGVDAPTSIYGLIKGLADLPRQGAIPVVLDALDEAASEHDRQQIAEALAELAVLPSMRVAVATRPLTSGNSFQANGLLAGLGVTGADSPNLVDLDTDTYFDAEGLRQFAAALLSQEGMDHPGPPGRAWEQYRARPEVRERLAAKIAEQARRNFLVATLAADQRSASREVVDPAAEEFSPDDIPSSVGEAWRKYFDQLPEERRERVRVLVTALAYARGAGLDDSTWLAFVHALGYSATALDLDVLRRSRAADYVIQSAFDSDAEPISRLFHQALVDELLTDRQYRSNDERALFGALLPDTPEGWEHGRAYARRHAAEHAAAAGQLSRLLNDFHYLTVADLTRLMPVLPTDLSSQFAPVTAVLRRAYVQAQALPAVRRARLLTLTSAHLGLHELQEHLQAAFPDRFTLRWAHSLGSPHQQLFGHDYEVTALAIGRLGNRDVIVSGGGRDATVRIWDEHGHPIGTPLTGHEGDVTSVAIGRLGNQDVIVSGSEDATVRIWDEHGHPIGTPLTGHEGDVTSVAIGRLGNQDVIVSGSEDATVRIWDEHGHPIGTPLTGHEAGIREVAVGRLGDRDVIVSIGERDDIICAEDSDFGASAVDSDALLSAADYGAAVWVWDQCGQRIGELLIGHRYGALAVTVGRFGNRDVIIAAGSDTVRIWDQHLCPAQDPINIGHDGAGPVAIGHFKSRDVIVLGSGPTVLTLDEHGNPIGDPLTGHEHGVTVAAGRLGDRDVIVSGSGWHDATVRVWDYREQRLADPLTGHHYLVENAAAGRLGDRDVVVSCCCSVDETVRVWDVRGRPVTEPLAGHDGGTFTVAVGRLGGQDVLVSGGGVTIRIWDQRLQPLTDPIPAGHAVEAVRLGRLGERDVLVSSGHGALRIWDECLQPVGDPIALARGGIGGHGLALGRLANRDVIVSGGSDGALRILGETGCPIGDPLTGHTGEVLAVALGRFASQDVIVSGSEDGTVRLWDQHGRPFCNPLAGHRNGVYGVAVASLRGDEVIVSCGRGDTAIRVWDNTLAHCEIIDLLEIPTAMVIGRKNHIYAATGYAICAWQINKNTYRGNAR